MATALAPEKLGTERLDIQEVWRAYKEDPENRDLRNRLVEEYLPLVRYNGERIWQRLPEGVELDDLISAGVFGLMDAIEAFDLSRGVKFETYCVPRIRGAMLDELRTMDWVPRLVRSKASKLQEATKTLEARLGRHPTEQELASHMELSLADLEKMMLEANAVNLISLNKKWYETDSYKDVREIDILEDKKGEDPTRRIQKNDLMRLVTKGLNRNERLIIILYYYEELTMKEIGATLDLSESRVSQMHSSIVARLQTQLGPRRPDFATQRLSGQSLGHIQRSANRAVPTFGARRLLRNRLAVGTRAVAGLRSSHSGDLKSPVAGRPAVGRFGGDGDLRRTRSEVPRRCAPGPAFGARGPLAAGVCRNVRTPDPPPENTRNSGKSPAAEEESRDAKRNAKKRRSQRIRPLRSSLLCVLGSSHFLAGSGVLNAWPSFNGG